jgi:hypothetical protein
MRANILTHAAAAAACVLLGTLPALAATSGSVEAVWAPRHVTFIYQGFTTHYSCGGLREEIRSMLTKLGARDLRVGALGCIRGSGVETFPGVRVTMRVLVPAASQHAKAGSAPVAAHWQNVVLMASNAGFEEQGNCELIEQFKETFLPLFTTRHISYQSNCVPHQLTLGTHLSAEVLIPDARPAPRH